MAGTQTCQLEGREGETCHATRPCAAHLDCQIFSQTCEQPAFSVEWPWNTRPETELAIWVAPAVLGMWFEWHPPTPDVIVRLGSVVQDKDRSVVLYKATEIPPGLRVDKATGIISGTPTVAGKHNVEIVAEWAIDGKTVATVNTGPAIENARPFPPLVVIECDDAFTCNGGRCIDDGDPENGQYTCDCEVGDPPLDPPRIGDFCNASLLCKHHG